MNRLSSAAACAAFLCLFGSLALADAPAPWVKVHEQAGIVVHRRPPSDSKLSEFRARGVVEAPLPAVLAVLQDHGHAKDWSYRCVASRLLEKPDPHSEIVYERSGAPWPVQDRDVIVRSDETYDAAAHQVRITMKSIDYPKIPPVSGAVRMPFLRGHWTLTVEHDGAWTHVEYQIHADAGGMIPDWLADNGSKMVPHDTLVALRKQVARKVSAALERELAARPEVQAVLASVQPGDAERLRE